jgi:hypothetical protein
MVLLGNRFDAVVQNAPTVGLSYALVAVVSSVPIAVTPSVSMAVTWSVSMAVLLSSFSTVLANGSLLY